MSNPKRPSVLKNMKITEVSLCRAPASPGSDVHFFKGDLLRGLTSYDRAVDLCRNAGDDALEKFDAAIDAASAGLDQQVSKGFDMNGDAERVMSEAVYAVGSSISEIYGDDKGEKAERVGKEADEFVAFIKAMPGMQMSGGKGANEVANKTKTKADPEGTGKITAPEHLDKSVDAGKIMGDGSIVAKADEPASNVGKSVTLEDGQVVINKADLDNIIKESVTTATKELTDKVAKMETEKADGERLAKATALADGVPNTTPETVASILKSLEGNEEATKGYIDTLNAARTGVAKWTREIGTAGDGHANDPTAQIETLSKALVDKAAEKGTMISMAKAMDEVLANNPELYAAYKQQRAARGE